MDNQSVAKEQGMADSLRQRMNGMKRPTYYAHPKSRAEHPQAKVM